MYFYTYNEILRVKVMYQIAKLICDRHVDILTGSRPSEALNLYAYDVFLIWLRLDRASEIKVLLNHYPELKRVFDEAFEDFQIELEISRIYPSSKSFIECPNSCEQIQPTIDWGVCTECGSVMK